MDTDKPNAACAATTDFGLRRDERKNFLTEGNQDFAEPEKKISSFPSPARDVSEFSSVQVRFAVLRLLYLFPPSSDLRDKCGKNPCPFCRR
jgi:hypothetical protein